MLQGESCGGCSVYFKEGKGNCGYFVQWGTVYVKPYMAGPSDAKGAEVCTAIVKVPSSPAQVGAARQAAREDESGAEG